MMTPGLLARLINASLEATIVGSFTKIGYHVRSRLENWDKPSGDLTNQVAVVTGATSGIGKATAKGLMRLGAQVHVTSRSADRADEAAEELNKEKQAGHAIGHALDTADFESVMAFVDELRGIDEGVDMLIHNAGALSSAYETNDDGIEMTLASHLIGPYLLTKQIKPTLNKGARVIFMSSGGMYTQKLDVDDIEVEEESYRGSVAYAKAKRGQIELVTHLAASWAPGVIMHAMHPGWVDTAGVDAGLPGFGKVMGPLLRSAEQGADTMIWLAANGARDFEPGLFWLDRHQRRTAYLPGTETDADERQRLIDWLDLQTLPASI